MKADNIKKNLENLLANPINDLVPKVATGSEIKMKSWKPVDATTPNHLPEVLFITSFPPRVCGIATYSQDLITALNDKFGTSFNNKVCALESGTTGLTYGDEVVSTLDTSNPLAFISIAQSINSNSDIKIVLIQHEFGFFSTQENSFLSFLHTITKPIVLVFHTVLPHPNSKLMANVQNIAYACGAIIVMTKHAAKLLMTDYLIPKSKITVIGHGTHLVPHLNKNFLKGKHNLTGNRTFETKGFAD